MIYRREHFGETGLSIEHVSYKPEGISTYCVKLSDDVEERDLELVRQTLLEAGWSGKDGFIFRDVTDATELIGAMTLAGEFGIYLYNARTKANMDFARLVGVMPDADGATNVPELLAAVEKSARHAADMYSSIYAEAEIPEVLDGLGYKEGEPE
ncbi:MAG: hypothetical protein KAJ24_07565 [Candidatus Aenigmarchaeota archaeon]|nr:hypothetical protein [Candidatus Aenigmarchaeota archaeon]